SEEQFFVDSMRDALAIYHNGLKEAKALIEKAASGAPMDRFKDIGRLGQVPGRGFVNTFRDFLDEQKGAFTRGQLTFKPGQRPGELKGQFGAAFDAVQDIADDRRVAGGLDYAGLGIKPPPGLPPKPRAGAAMPPPPAAGQAAKPVDGLSGLNWQLGSYGGAAGALLSLILVKGNDAGNPADLKPVEAALTARGVEFSNNSGGRVMVMGSSAQPFIREVLMDKLKALNWEAGSYQGTQGKLLSLSLKGHKSVLEPVEDILIKLGVPYSNRTGTNVVLMDRSVQDFIKEITAARKIDTAALLR
ncbi:MAG: hypothetical protein K2Q01_04785, partial [Rickettsiales bacterium]|nr:hypothetical protein [Rickettsiales bacterium]